jgi:hypothetical protein
MNPIITTIIVSYGSTYLIKYAIEAFTYAIFKITANTVTSTAKVVYNKSFGTPKPIGSYELINVDENNDPILDEIIYVTSKERTMSIDQGWILESQNSLSRTQTPASNSRK